MRTLIVDTGRCIAPFGDPVADSLLLFGTTGQAVEASLTRLGCEPVRAADASGLQLGDDEPVLVLADHVFASFKALRDFLRTAAEQSPARLALRRTPSVDYLRPVSEVETAPLEPAEYELSGARIARLERAATEKVLHDVFLVHGRDLPRELSGEKLLGALRTATRPVVVKKRELGVPMRLPVIDPTEGQTLSFPVTSTLVADLRHWVHLLWLNQVALGMYWMDRLRDRPLWMLWRALSGLALGRGGVLRRLVVTGRNCRIHPTAHLELCVLGDNVVVGPHASIRNSFVGSGSEIGDRATLLSSLVGPGGFITPKTFLVFSAAYPQATIGNYKLQVSLIGREAHLNPWAGLIDAKFRGAVRVDHEGTLRSTERSFLGSCVGHRAVLASKVLIQPGRAIPNDTVVVMRPDEVIAEVPTDLPAGEPLVRDHGTLVPLKALPPAAGPG